MHFRRKARWKGFHTLTTLKNVNKKGIVEAKRKIPLARFFSLCICHSNAFFEGWMKCWMNWSILWRPEWQGEGEENPRHLQKDWGLDDKGYGVSEMCGSRGPDPVPTAHKTKGTAGDKLNWIIEFLIFLFLIGTGISQRYDAALRAGWSGIRVPTVAGKFSL
jgi:hypothetical protein